VKYNTFKISIIILFFLTLIQFELVLSQKSNLYFEHFSTEEGLSQNIINSIAQDSKGFIWIATQAGINKFDGYNFEHYTQKTDNNNSLVSSFVRNLCIDKHDRLWISTVSGLNCYDIKTDKYYLFQFSEDDKNSLSDNFINYTYVDKLGFLWVATQNGLNKSKIDIGNKNKINESDLKFVRYWAGNKINNTSNNEIKSIYEDSKSNIWICTNGGLNKIENKTNKITQIFYNNSELNKENYNRINRLIEINESFFLVATDGGILSLNPKTNSFKSFEGNPFFIKNKVTTEINDLVKDNYGNVWIATDGDGLISYNINNKKFTIYKNETNYSHSLKDNFINSLFFDRSSTLFIGLHKGLNVTCLTSNRFDTYRYAGSSKDVMNKNMAVHIAYQNNETVWFAMRQKGLMKFNPKTNKYSTQVLKQFSDKGISLIVQHILPEDENNLWVCTQKNGLLLYNHKTGKIKQYKHNENENSISSNNIYWLKKDKSNNLWIATFGGGLNKLDLKTDVFKNYKKTNNKNKTVNLNYITEIEFDKDSLLWIGTFGGGLNCLNTKTEKFTNYKHSLKDSNSISSDFCITMHFSKDGSIWFGTATGLNKYDKRTGKFTIFNKKDGLANLLIYSIEEDNKGNLWIGSNGGLFNYNKKTNKFVNYTIKDGLQDNEFNSGVSLKFPNGKMLFGGINGFNIFNPDSINVSNYESNVNITNLKLFYNDVEIKKKYNDDILLNKSITYTDTIVLSYKNNVISFEFASTDYKNPKNIKYAFLLKGFEKKWNFTSSNKRFVTYTNLRYGKYTLKIKSTNSDGIWNKKEKKLTIIIEAPFWQTNYAKIMFLILFVSIVIFVSMIRTKVLKKQKEKLENQVKERTKIIEKQGRKLKDRYKELLGQKQELKQQAGELILISELLDSSNKKLEEKVKERTKDLEIALEKAKDAEKLISSFLSNLSHEIRTPMNAIIGFSQIISTTEIEDKEKTQYAEIIENNVDLLLNQIDNIMDIAKLHTGQYVTINKNFNVAYLFRELFQKLKSEANLKKGEVDFNLFINEKEELQIFTDEEAFKHIVFNLVENALKFTEKGLVEFGYRFFKSNNEKEKSRIEIFVNDTGIGIKEESQKIIFKPFSKIEASKDQLHRGTGLGLALVKNLTEKLNGRIELDSKPGKGTKIKILIPLNIKRVISN